MQKQHHWLMIFFLIVAVVAAIMLWRRGEKLRAELDAATAQNRELQQRLERETNQRLNAQQELASQRRALSGHQAALHEFMQRVHVVHDAALNVAIEATPETLDEHTGVTLVISAELVTADGRVWRFMNDPQHPPAVELTDAGTARLTFACTPVRGADIQGRPVAELAGVIRLRTPYQPVLSSARLIVTPESTKEIVLVIDGMEVVRAAPVPAAPETWEYDVAAAFSGLYERYQQQLRNRIEAAAATATAPQVVP